MSYDRAWYVFYNDGSPMELIMARNEYDLASILSLRKELDPIKFIFAQRAIEISNQRVKKIDRQIQRYKDKPSIMR